MRCKTPNSQKHRNFLDAIHLIMEDYMEAIGVIAKEAVLIEMIQVQIKSTTVQHQQNKPTKPQLSKLRS